MCEVLAGLRLESGYHAESTDWTSLPLLIPSTPLELFLPSYANDFDAQELEHKQDPIHDIILSEEDAAAMLPK